MSSIHTVNLRDIIDKVSELYPDHFLQTQFKQLAPTNVDSLSVTETLAAYLVKEIESLYDPDSSSEANLRRIITNLDISAQVLSDMTEHLKSLKRTV